MNAAPSISAVQGIYAALVVVFSVCLLNFVYLLILGRDLEKYCHMVNVYKAEIMKILIGAKER